MNDELDYDIHDRMNVIDVISRHDTVDLLRTSTFQQHDEETNFKDTIKVTSSFSNE